MRPSPRLRAFAVVAFVAGGAAFAAEPSARADEISITPEARTHFTAGVRLLQDPSGARYEEAYQEFKVAYASSPSPRILGNMGLCAMKLERDEEALHAYEKYLAGDAKIEASERTQIETDVGTLRASLVHVTVTVDAPDVRIVDVRTPVQGAAVTNVYGPITGTSVALGIHPGHHTFTAKRDGYLPATWEIDALPGARPTHTFALQRVAVAPLPVAPPPALVPTAPVAPPPIALDVMTRPTPAAVYALGGVTIALAGVAAVTGVLALSKRNDFDQINDGTPANYLSAVSLRDAGQKLNVATDVLLGAAVGGAAITLGAYLGRPTVKAPATMGGTPKPPATMGAGALRLRLGAAVLPGVNGAALEGAF